MRVILTALSAALFFAIPSTSQAQLGSAHFKAWDAHERGGTVKRPRATRGTRTARTPRAARRSIATRISPAIATRISPAIARDPVLRAVGAPIVAARAIVSAATQILPHPSGCPRRLFCGCGAAIEVFGRPVRHLWLAANWLKFPPASPGPGMVAANRRHVMVIRQYLGNGKALVYDANGGGGLTRLHVRSLSGYSIRNPRA